MPPAKMFALTVYFLVSFSLCTIRTQDVSTNTSPTDTTAKSNETEAAPAVSTEPSAIERKIQLSVADDPGAKNSSAKEFRPSPQLETVYEFNKHPVAPAVGEAKQTSHLNAGETGPQPNSRSFFWPTMDLFSTKKPAAATPTEGSWVRRVVFPAQTAVETTRDRPYPFVTGGSNPHHLGGSFDTRQPPRAPPTFSSFAGPVSDDPRGYGYGHSKWDGYENGGSVTNGPVIMHKTHYESYGPPEPTSSSVSSISPIKKIIGLLAAFIPIGLLISALTPSVIQVVPMNTTQSRSRSEIRDTPAKRLVSSLNTLGKIQDAGCEERILCELLLSAGASKNAEEHVENLLQTFTEQERDAVQKAEELQRIYEAVDRQNCKSLSCSDIEKNQQKKKKKVKDKS